MGVTLAAMAASTLPGARAAEPATLTPTAALRLRRALACALPGGPEVWPFWLGDQLLFVVEPPGGEPGRLARDDVHTDVVRRYPEASLYYLQRLTQEARRWSAAWPGSEAKLSQAVLLVPGAPSVLATLPQEPGLAEAAVALLSSRGRVWVDGELRAPSQGAWHQAAEALAAYADGWHARYRPRASLGGAPDLSELLRAEALYEAATELEPAHARATSLLQAVRQRLRAAILFARGQALLGIHERRLREGDRLHHEVEQRREAFFVGEAFDLVMTALSLDADPVGAAAAAERLRGELAGRSTMDGGARAELETEQRQEYEEAAHVLDLEAAMLEPDAMAGRRVRFTGHVVSHVPAKLPGGAGLPLVRVEGPSSPSGPIPRDAWVLVEPVAAGASQEASMYRAMESSGARVHVTGELSGLRRVPDEAGAWMVVPRVLAAYVSVLRP